MPGVRRVTSTCALGLRPQSRRPGRSGSTWMACRTRGRLPSGTAVTSGAQLGDPPHHVALVACESEQRAKEVWIDGRYRGVFSAMLQETLTTLAPNSTYRDLLGSTSARVRDLVMQQDPVGYASPVDALDQPLFGGVVQMRAHGITLEHYGAQWWIDVGAVHGIQPLQQGGDTTVLAVLPPRTQEGVAPSRPLGQVRVTEGQLGRCRVSIVGDWQPDSAIRYPTVVIDLPVPPTTVEVRTEHPQSELVRRLVAASPHLNEASGDPGIDGARFVIRSESNQTGQHFFLARADGTDIADPVPLSQEGAAIVVRRMEHLARWRLIKVLENPGSALAHRVTITIVPAEPGEVYPPRPGERASLAASDDGLVHLSYRQTGSGWENPYIWIYLTNDSPRDLYCALLDLTDRYRCHSRLLPGTLIPAGATTVAFDGRPVDATIPEGRLRNGGAEARDVLKLIASEQRFQPDGYELPNLDGALPARSSSRRPPNRTILDRLADRVATRDVGDEVVVAHEWTTAMVTLVTHGPTQEQFLN